MLRDGDGERVDDARVDVEEVVAGHSGLARDARRDDDEVGAGEGGGELFGARVAGDLGGRRKSKGGGEFFRGLVFSSFFLSFFLSFGSAHGVSFRFFGRRLFFFFSMGANASQRALWGRRLLQFSFSSR